MRTKRNRLFTTLGIVGIAALSLTACAPGTGGGTEPAPEAEVTDFAGQELDYMYFTDGPDLAATEAIIAEFEKLHDVTVNLETVPFADLYNILQTRLSGGKAPDVARVATLAPFEGDLLDLNEYLGDDFAGQFLEGTHAGFVGENGEAFGAPSDLTMNGILVNTDLFEKAGVAVPPVDKPWTWDEMVKAAESVQAATGTEYAFAIDKSGHRLSTILAQNGTYLVDADGAALDPKLAVEALTPFTTMLLADKSPKDIWLESGSKYAGANDVFLAQQAPVYMSGNWQVAQFNTNATFGWAAAPNPCMAECGGFPGGKFTVAFAESDVKALAAEFVGFLTNAESQEQFVASSNFLPTRNDLSEKGVKYPVRQADMDVFLAEIARTEPGAYASAYSPLFNASAGEFIKVMSKVVAGELDLTGAMDELSAAVEKIAAEG